MSAKRRRVFHNIGKCLLVAGLLTSASLTTGLFAQTDVVRDARYYTQRAIQAYRAKDYATYLDNMKQAQSLRPDHPTYMYNLASAYALNGNKVEAINWLGRVARMGLVYPAVEDDDFASIKSSEEFQSLIRKFEANKTLVTHSSEAFTLEEKGLVTEGLAYDPATETFYVSSVHRRKIVSFNKKDQVRDFSTAEDGLWSVLGMKVDAKRHLLWVCSASLPQMKDFAETDKNRTGVFKYDLRTRKLVKKYLLPDTTKAHVFGDLVVHPSGDVFVTDSTSPAVYIITQQRDELEIYSGPQHFVSPQGLDLSSDGKKLFMSDYLLGLFVFDLKSRKLTKLEHAGDVSLFGLDGLYFFKGSLLAVQNGTNPQRVVRLFLNPQMSRIEKLEVIEANNPKCDEPTLGVIVRDTFYFIANSQWGSVDEHAQLVPAERLRKPLILLYSLESSAGKR